MSESIGILLSKIYYESTTVRGVPIFVDFVGRQNHEFWSPTKEISIDVYTENLKTMNSRIHENWYPRIKVLSQYVTLPIAYISDSTQENGILGNVIGKGIVQVVLLNEKKFHLHIYHPYLN